MPMTQQQSKVASRTPASAKTVTRILKGQKIVGVWVNVVIDGPLEGICSKPCRCPGDCKNKSSSGKAIQPVPEPVEATTVKNSKSNSSERQIEPIPKPVEGKTVKGSKSNTSEGQQSQDLLCGANGTSTCGGLCERPGDICIQDCADCPCACTPGI